MSDIPGDLNDAAIVKTIIALAEHLGLQVVAEGVETVEHLEFLQANGCRYVQGFLLARPVPAQEIPALVAELGARYAIEPPDRRYAT